MNTTDKIMALADEIWVQTHISPNYLVSNFGRIKSLARPKAKERLLKTSTRCFGYHRVSLRTNGKQQHVFVHRLVLTAFVGPAPDGMDAAHLDGNRDNNALTNLRWTTRRENCSHKHLHGTHQAGEKNPHAKLTFDSVQSIKKFLATGMKQRDIAAMFAISEQAVSDIKRGRSWSHAAMQEKQS